MSNQPTRDKNGHLIDCDNKLIFDPECSFCDMDNGHTSPSFIEERVKEFEKLPHYKIFLKDQSDFLRQSLELQRQKIKTDLIFIADEGEYEDLRREIERYFS